MNGLAMLNRSSARQKRDDLGAILPQSDRREHSRIRAIGRIGRLEAAGDRGLCRVHDLSDGGMKIETSLDMSPGEWVRITFDGNEVLFGRLVWRQGYTMGIQLTRPVDCCRLVRELADGHWNGSVRPLRLPVRRRAQLVSAAGTVETEVVDISQKGMKIRHPLGLPEGELVEIRIQRGFDIRGIVRWSNDEFVGIEFSGMIAVECLASAAQI